MLHINVRMEVRVKMGPGRNSYVCKSKYCASCKVLYFPELIPHVSKAYGLFSMRNLDARGMAVGKVQ